MDKVAVEILRCQDEWYSLASELKDLKYCSIALADGNVRRIQLPESVAPASLVEEIESFVKEKNGKLEDLRYWALHPSCENKNLSRFLFSKGFKFNLEMGMALGQEAALSINPNLKIENCIKSQNLWETIKTMQYREDSEILPSKIQELIDRDRKRFRDERVEIYIASRNGEPAGMMALFSSEKTAQIDEVYTVPKFRKQRVASTLMKAIIDIARQRKMENIIIAAPRTFDSYHIYKKMGFIEKVELPGYFK